MVYQIFFYVKNDNAKYNGISDYFIKNNELLELRAADAKMHVGSHFRFTHSFRLHPGDNIFTPYSVSQAISLIFEIGYYSIP